MTINQKKPLSRSLPRTIAQGVKDGQQLAGQAWPCHVVAVENAIVTVAFDVNAGEATLPQVTCPVAESFYVMLPIQVGDTGVVISAGARLGGITELGSGLAPLSLPSNLGAMLFVPLGRKSWALPDANAVLIQGPNGAIIRTIDENVEAILNEDEISLNWKGVTIVIDSSGITLTADQNTINGNLTVNGNTVMNGTLQVSGNVTAEANLAVGGSAAVTGAVTCASMTCAGAGSFATLTVGGKSFLAHTHLPGGYHIGSNSVTGNSGAPA
jgi:hypothetical protein